MKQNKQCNHSHDVDRNDAVNNNNIDDVVEDENNNDNIRINSLVNVTKIKPNMKILDWNMRQQMSDRWNNVNHRWKLKWKWQAELEKK